MGESSAVFGRITSYSEDENNHNLNVISKLPYHHEMTSYITNEMFNRNQRGPNSDYTIGFASSYKSIKYNWEEWLEEFESILEKLKWDNSKVIIETELYGSHQYMWINKKEKSKNDEYLKNPYNLIEKKNWYFGKGHRNFWGMEMELGWKNEFEELRTLKVISDLLDASIGSDIRSSVKGTIQTELELTINKDGLKSIISRLIKLYINSAEREVEAYTHEPIDVGSIFGKNSDININKLNLETSTTDTKWIALFVDALLEQKKGSL